MQPDWLTDCPYVVVVIVTKRRPEGKFYFEAAFWALHVNGRECWKLHCISFAHPAINPRRGLLYRVHFTTEQGCQLSEKCLSFAKFVPPLTPRLAPHRAPFTPGRNMRSGLKKVIPFFAILQPRRSRGARAHVMCFRLPDNYRWDMVHLRESFPLDTRTCRASSSRRNFDGCREI